MTESVVFCCNNTKHTKKIGTKKWVPENVEAALELTGRGWNSFEVHPGKSLCYCEQALRGILKRKQCSESLRPARD